MEKGEAQSFYCMKTLLALALAALISPLCRAGDTAPRTFDVIGIVKKLKPEIRTAVIDHEQIPGYMDAMVMSLEVHDVAEFTGIKPGDKIRFRMHVTKDDGWIDELKVIEAAKAPPSAEIEPAPLKPIVPGETLPDAVLVDDQGKSFRLSDLRGQAVALTFIYTRCPFPNFCPRVNRQFKEAQELLKNDAAAPRNWKLLSVSIEPDRDTPEVLAKFAKDHGADPAHWQFATGTLRDITKLTIQSGLNFWDDRGLIQHNLRTIVADSSGRVTRVFSDDQLTAASLASAVQSAAGEKPCPCSLKNP